MTHEEEQEYLIEVLLTEMPQYRPWTSGDEEARWRLLRSLFNLRPPMPAGLDFLSVQDKYLSEEVRRRGVVDSRFLKNVGKDRRVFLWQGDITRLKADAIVNAANSGLLGCFHPCHSCIDNMIHTYAGVQLRLACNDIIRAQGQEEPGWQALKSHLDLISCQVCAATMVGPNITGPLDRKDCRLLAGCYEACLELAAEHDIQSIAFCCISTGVFHFPQEKAAEIAVETVSRFLEHDSSLRQVIFNVFTDTDRGFTDGLCGMGIIPANDIMDRHPCTVQQQAWMPVFRCRAFGPGT